MNNYSFDMKTEFPKKVSIIGAARSGLAAAQYFVKRGIQVFISDSCDAIKLKDTLVTNGLGSVEFEGNAHTDKILDTQLIILSPGVPSDIPVLVRARELSIPVWSEMELGFRVCKAPFVAVTGSTGKSTTVSLIGEAIKASGIQTIVAGNIGIPVISQVTDLPVNACVVAEVSSFQLETIDQFRPKAAAIVNFMKNHLDRYRSEQDYYNAKKEIARNFTKENFLVLNALDPLLMQWAKEMDSKTILVFACKDIKGFDCFWYEQGNIHYRFNGESDVLFDVSEMKIKGIHNYYNACIASAVAKIAGASNSAIRDGICSFKGLEHRLEYVAEVNGITWYNDSKSTTAESMIAAVESFPHVHLIAGGRDKGCEFEAVNEAIKKHVRMVYLIGEATERMYTTWQGCAPMFKAPTLEAAVNEAMKNGVKGDAVVFSPGCSSFDMFKNYEERGKIFRNLVNALQGNGKC